MGFDRSTSWSFWRAAVEPLSSSACNRRLPHWVRRARLPPSFFQDENLSPYNPDRSAPGGPKEHLWQAADLDAGHHDRGVDTHGGAFQ